MNRRRTLSRPVAAVALAAALAGCAPGHDQAAPGGHHHEPPVGSAVTEEADVRIGLTEWTIATSASTVPAGELTLRVTNTGATEHDVLVKGEAGTRHSMHLAPGEQTYLTVRAKAGEVLTLWCSLPGHEASGMHTTLKVAQ